MLVFRDQFLFTARFARGAECAKGLFFSFAVERPANENLQALQNRILNGHRVQI